MTNKRKNPLDDPKVIARLYRPLTTFQKAFGYHIVGGVPDSEERVSKYEVLQLQAVQRVLRKYPIETLLAEWGLWNLLPFQEQMTTKPDDKRALFLWLEKVLIGAAFYGKYPGDVETTQFAMAMIFILRAYLAVNSSASRPRSTREAFEQVNFDHLLKDAMNNARQDVLKRCPKSRSRKAVRRAPA